MIRRRHPGMEHPGHIGPPPLHVLPDGARAFRCGTSIDMRYASIDGGTYIPNWRYVLESQFRGDLVPVNQWCSSGWRGKGCLPVDTSD